MGHVTAPLGVVTGLQVEADIARAIPGSIVLCLGPGPGQAHQAATQLVQRGARALMSFGVAGGLDPALAPGDLVCAPASLAKLLDAKGSSLTTVEVPALTPDEKSALHTQSGASAVDMESSSVAAVAQAHGLDFLCVRAICDTAGDTIPPLALKGVDALGNTRTVRVAAGLLARPQDLAALMTLGKRQKAALAALKAAAGQITAA